MATQNLTCGQKQYLINALEHFPCSGTPGTSTQTGTSETETPQGFQTNRPEEDSGWDPENEVIFDPENEVIFDPESEVIFDPQQIFNPQEGQAHFNIFDNIYDSYGYKINLMNCREDLVKLLYWLFKYEQCELYTPNNSQPSETP